MKGKYFILLVLGLITAYDVLTTIYGTIRLLGSTIESILAALLLGVIIGGLLYFSCEIQEIRSDGFPYLIKPLWWLALGYDLWTSFIGNNQFIVKTIISTDEWQKVVLLFGLTLFVSSCPVILSYLRNSYNFMINSNQ